jgi:L-lactate dehydrogenase complex protein LldE
MFSVKEPGISAAMLDRKLRALIDSGASTVTSTDLGCLMQIEGGLRRCGGALEVRHIARLLDQATAPEAEGP